MPKLAALACAAPLALALAGPGFADVRGSVHEIVNPEASRAEWRRQPLAGAYVAIVWEIAIPAPAHATTSCRYAELARTDAKGEYIMEGPNFITAALAHTIFAAYAPGRRVIAFRYPGTLLTPKDITLVKSDWPSEQRLSLLNSLARPGCAGWDAKLHDPKGLLRPMQQELLREAATLPAESDYAKNTLRSLEAEVRGPQPALREPIRVEIAPAQGSIEAAPAPAQPSSR